MAAVVISYLKVTLSSMKSSLKAAFLSLLPLLLFLLLLKMAKWSLVSPRVLPDSLSGGEWPASRSPG